MKINLLKLKNNCKIINDRCAGSGISVVGVSKCVLGDIRIAEVFLKAGIGIIGDSRLKNLEKLRDRFGKGQPLVLLRTPMISEITEMIKICDISMNTQIETIKEISRACSNTNSKHKIIIMVETDDIREGLFPQEVLPFCREVRDNYKNIEIWGIGTNARCISKKKPTTDSIDILVHLKKEIMDNLSIDIPVVSGGNSSAWELIEKNKMPEGINQVRIGEAILLGHETSNYKSIAGTYGDAFILEAEIIEVKKKKRHIYKLILALGVQDVNCENIKCNSAGLKLVSQSSDHTVMAVQTGNEDKLNLNVGDVLSFNLNYFGLLSCMTSPFVEKKYIEE
ncbi:MAG: alanine racemase [Actinobacteria bacterium]|nr:alanine racemase [Actinomycetota bacterium]